MTKYIVKKGNKLVKKKGTTKLIVSEKGGVSFETVSLGGYDWMVGFYDNVDGLTENNEYMIVNGKVMYSSSYIVNNLPSGWHLPTADDIAGLRTVAGTGKTAEQIGMEMPVLGWRSMGGGQTEFDTDSFCCLTEWSMGTSKYLKCTPSSNKFNSSDIGTEEISSYGMQYYLVKLVKD